MTDRNPMSLDVRLPDDVLSVLREAIDKYNESAIELDSAWQDPDAGRPWAIIAKELERCATRIEKRAAHWLSPRYLPSTFAAFTEPWET